jgi:probable phosphoglycerate mutase
MIGLLIRHGHVGAVDSWLAGRRDNVTLDAAGHVQVTALRDALRWTHFTAVYSSPLQRALQTAEALAKDHGLPLHVRPALTDVDFGEWTGKTFDELESDPGWVAFNQSRATACPPGGEPLESVRHRIATELLLLSRAHPAETVVIVTHAEPIRCALAAFWRKSLDDVFGIQVLPAHVSAVGIDHYCQCVLDVNVSPDRAAD